MDKMNILKVLLESIGSLAESVNYLNGQEDVQGKKIVVTDYGYAQSIDEFEYLEDQASSYPRQYIAVFEYKQFPNQYQVVRYFTKMIEDLKKDIKKELDDM